MDITVFKKLLDDNILDFSKLLIKYYKSIGLSEIEAFVLIELDSQKSQGNTFLNPTKIIKNMTIPKDELLGILDGLMKKGYLTIQLKKMKSGKETEIFYMDETILKIVSFIEKEISFSTSSNAVTFLI